MGWGGVEGEDRERDGGGEREMGKEREREVGRDVLFLFPFFRNVFLALHFNKCNIFSVYPYQASSYLQAKLY